MNDAMRQFDPWVGEWDVTMTHAWFLESMDTEVKGRASFEWLADAFLVMRSTWEDDSTQEFVFSRNDPHDTFLALAHDGREIYRVFDMRFADGEWTLLREDPDFHQRVVIRAQGDRIDMRADASDDAGRTWRKDLDYIFVRR
jgi:hypothetical protein